MTEPNRSPLASLMAQAQAVKGKRFDERDLAGGAPEQKERRRRSTRGKVRAQWDVSPGLPAAIERIARQVGTSPASVAEWLIRQALESATVDDLVASLQPSRALNYSLWLPPSELNQSALQRFGLREVPQVEQTETGAENRTLLNSAARVAAPHIGADSGAARRRG